MKKCGIFFFFFFLLKTYIVGTRQNRHNEAVLTSIHDLCFIFNAELIIPYSVYCFRAKIRKQCIPCKPQFTPWMWGYGGVGLNFTDMLA